MTTELTISGMSCEACVAHVEKALARVPGVRSAVVDLASGTATVEHDAADVDRLIAAVVDDGYEAAPKPASVDG